jgi:REP-associated tyrosine transposase
MVESGEHLWNCMRYINLNMVRAGAVEHPSDWPWCGYDELVGARQKFLVLDKPRILELTESASAEDLRANHQAMIAEALAAQRLDREPQWTDSIAVGSRNFVTEVARNNTWRTRLDIRHSASGAWTVREAEAEEPYGLANPESEQGFAR